MPNKYMPKTRKQWTITGILAFFVTIVIPLVTWAGGLVPDFASKEDLNRLNSSQLELRQEYTTDKILIIKRENRELQQKMFELKDQEKSIPDFYKEELESNKHNLDKLELQLQHTQKQMESLRSTD